MGILDDIKNRLNIGRRNDDYDDYYDEDEYYDEYHDSYNNYQDDDRLYYDDDVNDSSANSPLVNMADIRSQPVGLSRGAGSREDRIPMPPVRERRSSTISGLAADDSEAFRDSLARSNNNSLVQLHSERIQLEANAVPEFAVPDASRRLDLDSTLAASIDSAEQSNIARYNTAGSGRSNAGAVIPRTARQLTHLRPQSYAEAENISISLRQGAAVVLDLTDVRPELAKRILDFSFGVTSAFEGQVDRYADRVYILTRNGSLTESERRQISI
ncbi:MAG: cell division protein SepF [Coriobacteriia bacterium]|nr:cell division protein SepF [Coriobacteriia bacterium]